MKKVIKNNFQMLSYIWKHQKILIFVALLFCLCDILSPIQDTYLPKMIIDRLSINAVFTDILPVLCIFVAISIYKGIMYPLYKSYFVPLAKATTSKTMNIDMIAKNKTLDLQCFETKEFFDKYTRALSEIDVRSFSVFESLIAFVRYILYMCTLFGIIVMLDPVLLVIGVFCAVITFLLNKKITRTSYEFDKKTTYAKRKCEYVKRILYLPEYAKETRFYPVLDLFKNKYFQHSNEIINLYKKQGRKIIGLSVILEIVTIMLMHGISLIYLVAQILMGNLIVGDFIALLLATQQFSNQLVGFGEQINKFYKNSLYVDDLNAIFEYKSEVENRISVRRIQEVESIVFKNVKFSYPNSDKSVLNGIDINIKKGQKVAIVGLNGSGKTTLIKLLLNLYNPVSGSIKINGEKIQLYAAEEYRKLFGVIFQDFHYLAYSVGENLLFRNMVKEDRLAVEQALSRVGIWGKISNLKEELNTSISKELSEEGVMFSGGELQAIMLARLFLKKYDILVLDEPTSALDPLAEYHLYQELFSQKESEQTIIVISHRLMTTKNADIIYFMENGKITEAGSHEELILLKGKYAELFNVQQNYYSVKCENAKGDERIVT